MTNPNLPSLTGIPAGKKGRTRRRRGKQPGTPTAHHTNLGRALANDDHDTARQHAFALIRSLRPKPEPTTEVTDTEAVEAEPAMPTAPKVPVSNTARLVAALRAKKG